MRFASTLFATFGLASIACSAAPAGETRETNEAEIVTKTQLVGQSLGPKQISLTFDDGPGPRTLELGTYLRDRGIKGTFFVVGNNATDGAVLQALRDQGHLIASHTFDHKSLPSLSSTDVVWEISATHERIAPYVDQNHLLLRAPYGAWDGDVADAINASPYSAYVGSIFWDVGGALTERYGADWDCWGKGVGVEDCGQRYINEIEAKGRGIVLMHDVHGRTIDMVKWMVPVLESSGYTFVRTDEVPDIAAALRGGGGVVAPPVTGGDCGGLTYDGRCDGSVATWCDEGQKKSKDCAASEKTCGIDPANPTIGFTCVPRAAAPPTPPATGCNGITYDGVCNGAVLFWCEGEELKTKDCASRGQRCDRDPTPGVGLNCVK